ncbi:MAG: hypothetical protein U1F83_06025 [Verrucomicrobiota bacterium]
MAYLTGPNDVARVKQTYAKLNLRAVVHPFPTEMDLALGAATGLCQSRAGASSSRNWRRAIALAARAVSCGGGQSSISQRPRLREISAGELLEQRDATPEKVSGLLRELVENAPVREEMKNALACWHAPRAAEKIAELIWQTIKQPVALPMVDAVGAARAGTKPRASLVTSTLT